MVIAASADQLAARDHARSYVTALCYGQVRENENEATNGLYRSDRQLD